MIGSQFYFITLAALEKTLHSLRDILSCAALSGFVIHKYFKWSVTDFGFVVEIWSENVEC